jgi:membrane protease YdiL (CAAX protease family)
MLQQRRATSLPSKRASASASVGIDREFMKLKKRKIKFAAIFSICWFGFLVLVVDGIIGFQSLVDYFGSYALVEVLLLLLVALPTLAVYKFVKE